MLVSRVAFALVLFSGAFVGCSCSKADPPTPTTTPSASASAVTTATASASAAPTASEDPTAAPSATATAAATVAASADKPTATGKDAGTATPTASASAAAPECGKKPLPDCPLQAWMKANLNPPVTTNDAAGLEAGLTKLAGMAPPGYTNWATIAKDGAKAAKGGDLTAAKASCRTCHDEYRPKYRAEIRGRKI